jgi:hypothetical protein
MLCNYRARHFAAILFDKTSILPHITPIGRLRDFRAGGFAFEWLGFCNSVASAQGE